MLSDSQNEKQFYIANYLAFFFWWMSLTDMCILLYAVHLCYRGVIFKQFGKIKSYFKCARGVGYYQGPCDKHFFKVKYPNLFSKLWFSAPLSKIGCKYTGWNCEDNVVQHMKKQRLVERRKPAGFLSWWPHMTLVMVPYSRA